MVDGAAGQRRICDDAAARVALPLIRELRPDLIVSFTFPYRVPPEITAIPRYGAVNLHPTVLPAIAGRMSHARSMKGSGNRRDVALDGGGV